VTGAVTHASESCVPVFCGRVLLSVVLLLAGWSPVSAAQPQDVPKDSAVSPERLRLIVETDAGGDPDDEQSLVRFLLYVNEGDSMTFLYLIPTGMNDPAEPTWGSWAGRYGRQEQFLDRDYYWANESDTWEGTTHRENTLRRWAVDLQNDFKARLDWCVKPFPVHRR
jgi:hypothetical protein